MSNELIFFLTTFLDLSFVLLFFRLGRRGLLASVIVNVILVSTFGSKLIPIFGMVTNVANVFYSSIFLAVNIMVERFDRKEGLKAVWAGFGALAVFILMGQFVVITQGVPETEMANTAIATLFKLAPRIAFASMFAYLVSQHLNLWIYDFLKQKSRLSLGLRNFISTAISQLVDSLLFFFLAFAGSIEWSVLWQTIAAGYGLKILIALISTFYIYASRSVKVTTEKSDEQLARARELPGEIAAEKNYIVDWNKILLVKSLAIVVSAIGLLVMGGWLFNIPLLTNINQGFVSMKFSTATSFFCAGILQYFIAEHYLGRKDLATIILPSMTMVIMLFMTTLFFSNVFNVDTGIESFLVQDRSGIDSIKLAGVPSVMTMLSFSLLSILSLFTLGNASILHKRFRRVGFVLTTIGSVALSGYAMNQPALFYEIPGFANGMAIHTSVAFILLGIGFLYLGFAKKLAQDEHKN